MIREFKYYLEENLVKKGNSDRNEAESLMKKADGRLDFSIKTRKIDENTAPYIFEDIYECLREAAQSLMALDGYKLYSHEALLSFLKEFFRFTTHDIVTFNRYRILRNNAVYRGEKISQETCKEALAFLLIFLPKLRKEFQKKMAKYKPCFHQFLTGGIGCQKLRQ
ncbi:MAG: hypothetical protein V1870_03980 [Candidatus Aenigmatarchaeota archaeon]